jgi:hypothetical protein
VTSIHDFFGASVVQAMYCETIPLLPKRLAYPEHIPGQANAQFFYNDENDFLSRLRHLLTTTTKTDKIEIRNFVSHYDWQRQITDYDTLFDNLIES